MDKQSQCNSPVRQLTSIETRQVAGGPGGYPVLGQQPGPQGDQPRLLTTEETRAVAGGPVVYPTSGQKPMDSNDSLLAAPGL